MKKIPKKLAAAKKSSERNAFESAQAGEAPAFAESGQPGLVPGHEWPRCPDPSTRAGCANRERVSLGSELRELRELRAGAALGLQLRDSDGIRGFELHSLAERLGRGDARAAGPGSGAPGGELGIGIHPGRGHGGHGAHGGAPAAGSKLG